MSTAVTVDLLYSALEVRGYTVAQLGDRSIVGERTLRPGVFHVIAFHKVADTLLAWVGSHSERRLTDVLSQADGFAAPVYEAEPLGQSGWLEDLDAAHDWLSELPFALKVA